MDETFDIVAHDTTQDTDPDRIHVLKLVVSSGLTYYVEVRQKPATQIFDQNIPVTNADQGIVVVTRVTEGTSISNTFERPIMLFGAIDLGEQVVDAARRLTIHVDKLVQNRPLVYRVHLTWNAPIAGDPAGQFDFTITPWTTDFWETVDIWIDSPRNNSGGAAVYENHEAGDSSKPVRNGDRPWVHHPNKIWARIRNTGTMPVNDVYVTFYVNSPPGIGDNGDWATLATKLIPTLPGRDPAVAGSGETLVSCDWSPSVAQHTCLQVAMLPQIGEINVDNNRAQENVGTFDSAGGSSHEPVELSTAVRSPFSIWRKVDAVVRGLPAGWHAVANHAWVWTAPKGTQPLDVVMWTDLHAPYDFTPAYIRRKRKMGDQRQPPDRALIRIEGWTSFDHRYLPIGGFLADIKANTKVSVGLTAQVADNRVLIRGCLTPPLPDVPITVEIIDAQGKRAWFFAVTDKQGLLRRVGASATRQGTLPDPGLRDRRRRRGRDRFRGPGCRGLTSPTALGATRGEPARPHTGTATRAPRSAVASPLRRDLREPRQQESLGNAVGWASLLTGELPQNVRGATEHCTFSHLRRAWLTAV